MDIRELKRLVKKEMNNDSIKLKGRWTATEKDPGTGEVLSRNVMENVITEDGAQAVAQMLGGQTIGDFEYIAIGDGPAAGDSEDVTQSSLVNEQARELDSSPTVEDDGDGHKIRWSAVFGPDDCVATEFGLFNDGSEGTMLSYNIPEIEKDAQNAELTLEYDLIVNEG